jgi:hypothetical protein
MNNDMNLEVRQIKIELHRMLYSEEFNTVADLKDGLEKLMKNQFNPPYMWPSMSLREATFSPRSESENLHELQEVRCQLKEMRILIETLDRTISTLHRKISHMATDKEVELFNTIGISYENKED